MQYQERPFVYDDEAITFGAELRAADLMKRDGSSSVLLLQILGRRAFRMVPRFSRHSGRWEDRYARIFLAQMREPVEFAYWMVELGRTDDLDGVEIVALRHLHGLVTREIKAELRDIRRSPGYSLSRPPNFDPTAIRTFYDPWRYTSPSEEMPAPLPVTTFADEEPSLEDAMEGLGYELEWDEEGRAREVEYRKGETGRKRGGRFTEHGDEDTYHVWAREKEERERRPRRSRRVVETMRILQQDANGERTVKDVVYEVQSPSGGDTYGKLSEPPEETLRKAAETFGLSVGEFSRPFGKGRLTDDEGKRREALGVFVADMSEQGLTYPMIQAILGPAWKTRDQVRRLNPK